jgi:uncharacterized cupin superfamily protein
MVEEARLEELQSGFAPATEGWFVINAQDAAWEMNDAFGAACFFEGDDTRFAELGVNLRVLWPGRSKWLYHTESNQEDILVLAGECLLLVEGEERPLKPWDFVHFPPKTGHAFVATGDTPCVIVMTGARSPEWPEKGIVYPRSELALRHGVGVETETSSPVEALAPFPKWHLRRPDDWNALPWS